jgi:hypothetical protein
VCDFYSRCDLGLPRIYGEGQACVDLYAASAREVIAQSPELEPFYESIGECAALESAPCPSSSTANDRQAVTTTLLSCWADVWSVAGDSCSGDVCAPGLRCTGASDTTCGECEVSPEGWCDENYDCEPLERCDDETNHCVSLLADGEVCSVDLDCLSGVCQAGTCQKPSGEGEACSDALWCDAYLKCVAGSCRAPGGAGSPCDSSDDCRYSFACKGGTCIKTGVSDIAVGEPCRYLGCVQGAYCDFIEGVCKSDAVGEPCSYSCGRQRACFDGKCANKLPVGAECSVDEACESSNCSAGSCVEELRCGAF